MQITIEKRRFCPFQVFHTQNDEQFRNNEEKGVVSWLQLFWAMKMEFDWKIIPHMEKAFTTQFKTLSCSHFTNSDTEQKKNATLCDPNVFFSHRVVSRCTFGSFSKKKIRHYTFLPKTALNAQNDQKQSFKLFFEFFTQKMTKTEIKTTNT